LRLARKAYEFNITKVDSILFTALSDFRDSILASEQFDFATRLLENPQRNAGEYATIARVATGLIDKFDDNNEVHGVVADAYAKAIELESSAKSEDLETYKGELRAHSTEFDLDTQIRLGRSLLKTLPLGEVYSFMSNEGRREFIYELAAGEGDHERDMLLFRGLVRIIKADPENEKEQADEHLISLGDRLVARPESSTYENGLTLFNGFSDMALALRPHSTEETSKPHAEYANKAITIGTKLLQTDEGKKDNEFLVKLIDISVAYGTEEQLPKVIDSIGLDDFSVYAVIHGKLVGNEKGLDLLTANFATHVEALMEQADGRDDQTARREIYKAGVDAIVATEDYVRAYDFADELSFSFTETREKRVERRVKTVYRGDPRRLRAKSFTGTRVDFVPEERERDADYTGYVASEAINNRKNIEPEVYIQALVWRGRPADITNAKAGLRRMVENEAYGDGNVYDRVARLVGLGENLSLDPREITEIGATIRSKMLSAGERLAYQDALRWAQLGQFDDKIGLYQHMSRLPIQTGSG